MPYNENAALLAQQEWNESVENPDRGGGWRYCLGAIAMCAGSLGLLVGILYFANGDLEGDKETAARAAEDQMAAFDDDVPRLDGTDHYNLDFSSELLLGISVVLALVAAMYVAYKVGTASTYRPSISTGETAVEREALQARLRL